MLLLLPQGIIDIYLIRLPETVQVAIGPNRNIPVHPAENRLRRIAWSQLLPPYPATGPEFDPLYVMLVLHRVGNTAYGNFETVGNPGNHGDMLFPAGIYGVLLH